MQRLALNGKNIRIEKASGSQGLPGQGHVGSVIADTSFEGVSSVVSEVSNKMHAILHHSFNLF